MKCLSELWGKMSRPVVRKRIDAEMGIYADRDAGAPIVGFHIDGAWSYKLSCAIGVVAAVIAVMWLWCRVVRFLRRGRE